MGRPLRYIPPNSVVEITTRTIHGRLLLRPSEEVTDIILGVIGRALSLFPVKIFAFSVLSNHIHILLSPENAAQLASFTNHINSNIAREVGRLHEWKEKFWGRRYRAIVVADEPSQLERLKYILSHGCKEGLVDRPQDWPGPSCIRALTEGEALIGIWHDRTAEFEARKRGEKVTPDQFAIPYQIQLHPLPCLRDKSEAEYRAFCRNLVGQIESETQATRKQNGRTAMGGTCIAAQNPHDQPQESESSPAPFVHASCRAVRLSCRAAYKAFAEAFRAAAASLRAGDRLAEFPFEAFPPALPFQKSSQASPSTA